MGEFLLGAEKAAKSSGSASKTLPELLDEIRADKKLSTAAEWNDGNKIRDGILKRAPDEAFKYASQWVVPPEKLEEKTVEMINTTIYFTGAAQNPPKRVKFDFYFIHCVNASIFWSSFNAQSWLSTANKARLLEWKGRTDLIIYASRRSPKLLLEDVTGYIPKELEAGGGEWKGIFRRLFDLEDDGHAVKLGRAIAHGEVVSKDHEQQDWCKIRTFMWEKLGNMAIDSVEGLDSGSRWVFSAGFEEAWKNVLDQPRQIHI